MRLRRPCSSCTGRGEVFTSPTKPCGVSNMATRPKAMNGSACQPRAPRRRQRIRGTFAPGGDPTSIRRGRLCGVLGIVGKQVHDARLVAVCHVHGTHLLTFNVSHFVRWGLGGGIAVVDPATLEPIATATFATAARQVRISVPAGAESRSSAFGAGRHRSRLATSAASSAGPGFSRDALPS